MLFPFPRPRWMRYWGRFTVFTSAIDYRIQNDLFQEERRQEEHVGMTATGAPVIINGGVEGQDDI